MLLVVGSVLPRQSGYLLDKGGNDGFSEFLFKIIVANGCPQKPLSHSRDPYSRSTEQSLSFFCCCFLHNQPRFAGLRMVPVPWSVSVQLITPFNVPPPVASSANQTCLVPVGCNSCISGIMPTAYILIAIGGLFAWFLHPRPRSLIEI